MSCPSEDQLAGYLLDSQAPELAEVREHLTTCATCQAWVQEVRQEDDALRDVRRVLVHEAEATTRGNSGTSIAIGGGANMTTLSAASIVSATPELQEYEILKELGRGGMGAVYLATQKSTKRKVALKVLLEGPFASARSKRRFEREVELAAQLQHPHIVTILESGISSGRYYFAMQYVEGERLDVYLAGGCRPKDPHPGPPPQSGGGRTDGSGGGRRNSGSAVRIVVRLFQQVSDAVSYAHQRGVIHRDLKPSNIIVDAQGEPHVLDFGLAKIADPSAEPEALEISITGQLMGTLPYMSPEQAQGLHHDLDVRTDVYSLGVILYEMLTGKFPYTVTGKISDILKNISETAPRRPSTLDPRIDDEVETIVLKSLCKERERRYQSAGELARDLGHYLAGEPIEAKRDSTVYLIRKMLRRHRVPVAAAAIFLIVVLTGAFALNTIHAHSKEKTANLTAINVLARSSYGPEDAPAAMRELKTLSPAARRFENELTEKYLFSKAGPERVMGSRAGVLDRPDAFWRSVDGGPLWRYGEWLELTRMYWPTSSGPGDPGDPTPDVIGALVRHLDSGSDRQKYVAACLLGYFKRPEAGKKLEAVALTQTHPGVVEAAAWACNRLGRKVQPTSSQSLLVDPVSRLTFARVPAGSFRPGSSPDDPDRYDDEDQPQQDVTVSSFMISTTEVTLAAFQKFFDEHSKDGAIFGEVALGKYGNPDNNIPVMYKRTKPEELETTPIRLVNLTAANRYCMWLADAAAEKGLHRQYRVPTEVEWEWACRGGNKGRFCYGDDPTYLTRFALCDAPGEEVQVATRMPNFYGLFDMHGGLWERCATLYGFVTDFTTGEVKRATPAEQQSARVPTTLPEPHTPTEVAWKEMWVLRGGAAHSPAVRCRCAQRNRANAHAEVLQNGFRVVMETLP